MPPRFVCACASGNKQHQHDNEKVSQSVRQLGSRPTGRLCVSSFAFPFLSAVSLQVAMHLSLSMHAGCKPQVSKAIVRAYVCLSIYLTVCVYVRARALSLSLSLSIDTYIHTYIHTYVQALSLSLLRRRLGQAGRDQLEDTTPAAVPLELSPQHTAARIQPLGHHRLASPCVALRSRSCALVCPAGSKNSFGERERERRKKAAAAAETTARRTD